MEQQEVVTRICDFPISKKKRCKQPVADDKPNCGRHSTELSADQLGQSPTIYKKDGELHVWAGEPDGIYCLVHNDPINQVLYQVAGETLPCCLKEMVEWTDKHGELHRDDGPAVIYQNGEQRWYQHGEPHREDGPAVIWLDGTRFWRQHGKQHRDDGPAIVRANGTQEWWWYGEAVTEEEHARLREQSENA